MSVVKKSTKDEIRKEVSRRIAQLTREEKLSVAKKIRDLVCTIKRFIVSKVIMVYLAKEDEVDTTYIIEEARRQGKKIVVPVVEGNEIIACRLQKNIKVGKFGIMEPVEKICVKLKEIDFILVPGRAFDLTGNRLGRGCGFYDRFLSKLSKDVYKVGVCFSCQIFDSIPVCSSDMKVDLVVSA